MQAEPQSAGGRAAALDDTSSAQLVSKLAREAQKRQEQTQKAARRARPEFVLEIEQSEVGYTFPPRLLPITHIDYGAFAELLASRWGLTPDLSGIKLDPSILRKFSESGDFEAQLIQHVLQSDQPQLTFRAGRYRVSDVEFVPILSVRLNYESILVSVAGISRVAEAVAQETVEAVSASAGAPRSWAAFESEIVIVSHATRTRVDLGAPAAFESLLSPAVLAFIDGEMTGGARYVAHAGGYNARHGLGPPPQAQLTMALDDLTFTLSRFDPETGMWAQTDLRMTVTTRGDYRSGIVSVISQLPYEVHVECIGKLIAALEEGSATTSP